MCQRIYLIRKNDMNRKEKERICLQIISSINCAQLVKLSEDKDEWLLLLNFMSLCIFDMFLLVSQFILFCFNWNTHVNIFGKEAWSIKLFFLHVSFFGCKLYNYSNKLTYSNFRISWGEWTDQLKQLINMYWVMQSR